MTTKVSIPHARPSRAGARSHTRQALVVFPSSLGWMAMGGSGRTLRWLTFGHRSAEAAVASLPSDLAPSIRSNTWNRALVCRLQAYASGARDHFLDVDVDPGPRTAFGLQVLRCCRQIPYGATLTYGQLAAKAGHPGAARVVGRSMAANPIPLVIPCHRVISSNGGLCGYSAAGGLRMKRRLLQLETGLLQNRGLGRAPRLARAGRDRRH